MTWRAKGRARLMNIRFQTSGIRLAAVAMVFAFAAYAASSESSTPPLKTVRVFWVKPSDVAYDKRFPEGIAKVVLEAQKYYLQELGKTFRLNNPIVEVDSNSRNAEWFYTHQPSAEGDKAYYAAFNGYYELQKNHGLDPQFGNLHFTFTSRKQERVTFSMFTMTGKKILDVAAVPAMPGNNVRTIGIPGLGSGLYLCTLIYQGKTYCKKLIIKP